MLDNAPIIMMQDPLHVGKKFRNPLLSAIRIVFWGEITLRVNHFCSKKVMYNKYYNTQ
jgi:hypothetical protein